MLHYDVIVIGSGGGSKITRPSADLGHRVAIIESGKLGGTCLNHGCIPSKMLIHSADVMHVIEESKRFNLDVGDRISVDFEALMKRVSRVIDAESRSIAPLYQAHKNIDLYRGHARFIDDHTVLVGKKRLTAPKIFITVGARPHIPAIEGIEDVPYMTYFEALRNTRLPKKLIVIGGGYIATEIGYFYAMMGSEVDFVVRSEMLRHEDLDVRKAFNKSFSKQFRVHYGSEPKSISYKNGSFILSLGKKCLKADACLVATGVQPNTDDLGLEMTGIKMKEGFIAVDDKLETDVKGVWAFGDCIGHHLFRHSANFQGEYLFKTLFAKGRRRSIETPPMPHAVFTNPQVASVGKREDDLTKGTYFVGKVDYKQSAMGMALRSREGFVKLIFDQASEKLIGAHIIGAEASNMIHMLIAYMQMHAHLSDLLGTIYIHPALPELVRNAARAAYQARDKLSRLK